MENDIHTEHCCKDHGCKYGAANCTVASGQLKQSFECEACALVHEDRTYWINRLRQEGWTVTKGDA